jgi:hypothetical protein
MMERDRKREPLRVCRAAWLIGVRVREYREIVAGERTPSLETFRRICKLYGWPQTFVADEPSERRDIETNDPLRDNAAMTVDEATADVRGARRLAGASLIIYLAALFLPLWASLGRWENAFPSVGGSRLTYGFLVHNFTVPLIIAVGLLIMSRGRLTLAAGVFLGAGLFAILDGVARPFYAGFSARPLILMCIEFLVGGCSCLARRESSPTGCPPCRYPLHEA